MTTFNSTVTPPSPKADAEFAEGFFPAGLRHEVEASRKPNSSDTPPIIPKPPPSKPPVQTCAALKNLRNLSTEKLMVSRSISPTLSVSSQELVVCTAALISDQTVVSRSTPTPVVMGRESVPTISQEDVKQSLLAAFRSVINLPPSWKMEKPLTSWSGVQVETSGFVTVDLSCMKLAGSVDFTVLPQNLRLLNLKATHICGVADLSKLPPFLEELNVHKNELSGEIDLSRLPSSLVQLDLGNNEFSGTLKLQHLPPNLLRFSGQCNNFYGRIDLTSLPSKLQYLSLESNSLSETIDLTKLPPSLRFLTLQENRLGGQIDLSRLPAGLETLNLGSNDFTGAVDVSAVPASLRRLNLQHLNITVEGRTKSPLPPSPSKGI